MILHLVNDEKIINRTIELFEDVFPGENCFVVFRRKEFKAVTRAANVISFEEYEARKNEFQPTSAILHFMSNRKIKFVNKYCPKDIPIYWVMWGSDLYDRLIVPKGFPMLDTENSYYKATKWKRMFASIVNRPNELVRIMRRTSFIRQRVKYLVTSTIENDYDLFLKYYPEFKNLPCKPFSYYPLDQVMGDEMRDMWATGNNIQIGNSGTPSNNHEYVLRLLSKLNIVDREIFVPISYSGKPAYKEALVKKGHEFFGDKFKPITDFMPLADYNQLMASASIAIYGNWRQEAVGNILVSLYLGAKVFLSNKSPIFEWAKKHGFITFELETISQADIDSPLDQASREHNRKILLDNFCRDKLFPLMQESFKDR